MADKRAIINPFTKSEERMRRNTRDTKWVSADHRNASTRRPGPGKTARIEAQQSRHLSSSATIHPEVEYSEVSPCQPQPPVLTAAIYDVNDLREMPDPVEPLPRRRSWSSLRGSVQDYDKDVSPREVTPASRNFAQSPVSPLHTDSGNRRNMPSAADPQSFSLSEQERNDSNITVFPHLQTSIKKTAKGTQTQWNLADLYRNAREIYDVGPRGEGQKLWSTYKRSKEHKQGHTELEQLPPKQMPTPRRPSAPGLSAHPPSEVTQVTRRTKGSKPLTASSSLQARKGSAVSRTSCEVPVRIGPDIQQFIDVSKPLPPVPQLHAAPRSHPRVEKKHPKATKTAAIGNTVSNAASYVQYSTQWHGNDLSGHNSHGKPKVSKAEPWYKQLVDLIPDEHAPRPPHRKANADILKTKISRPRPFTALEEGRTVNVAPECGGVGGPGAAAPHSTSGSHAPLKPIVYPDQIDLTQSRRPPQERMQNGQKGKQKVSHEHIAGVSVPRHWRDKLISPGGSTRKSTKQKGRNRKDSDASFACQGVPQTHQAYVSDPGPSTQFQHDVNREDESMLPQALFSGVRGGRQSARDTKFYEPYVDVLDEYQD